MNDLEQLLLNPSETRTLEIKTWLDTNNKDHQIKIAQALLALYNENGGQLLIGFDDTTCQPDPNRPNDLRTLYHQDTIQGIVSKHANPKFEIRVAFPTRDGFEYPIITVFAGVTTPTLVSADVFDSANKHKLRIHTLLARSIEGNGRIASIAATPIDLERIIKHCLDNREADFAKTLSRFLSKQERMILAQVALPESQVRDENPAMQLLERGHQRFLEAVKKVDEYKPDIFGTWEVAAQITPALTGYLANQEFLQKIMAVNPRWTGWRMWIDSRYFDYGKPITLGGAWQALVDDFDFEQKAIDFFGGNHFDFWCIEPTGGFYQLRVLEDDAYPNKVKPKTVFDWRLMTLRVADAINTSLTFAKELGTTNHQIKYVFRWKGMQNRKLNAWVNHRDMFVGIGSGESHEDVLVVEVEISADAALNQVISATHEVLQKLLVSFGGASIKLEQVQSEVDSLISRR